MRLGTKNEKYLKDKGCRIYEWREGEIVLFYWIQYELVGVTSWLPHEIREWNISVTYVLHCTACLVMISCKVLHKSCFHKKTGLHHFIHLFLRNKDFFELMLCSMSQGTNR